MTQEHTAPLANTLGIDSKQGMKGCDVLIHAAADTQHGRGTAQQKRTNEDGTRTVFEAARSAGIRKAIHISTESVLAAGAPLVNVDETHPLPRKPAGEYSRSKGVAENIALAFNSTDFKVVALRPRFVWGRDDTTALPTIVAAVRAGQFAWISGGTYLTSTIHIGNLCAAIERAIQRGRGGEVYFVADDEPVQFRHFLTQLLETQGIQAPDKSVPRAVLRVVAHMGDLIGAVSGGRIKVPLTLQSFATSAVDITLNIEKARKELDYVPVISREQGLYELRAVANL